MNIQNLTSHVVRIYADDGATELMTIPPSGTVARVSVKRRLIGEVNGIPTYDPVPGDAAGLPAPSPGVVYITSAQMRQAVPHRRDVYSPGELVRGADGQPIGCRGLDGNA